MVPGSHDIADDGVAVRSGTILAIPAGVVGDAAWSGRRGSAMLAADKLLLQSNVKQRSIELREKELNLFNSNFSAVGTQAAIMAGFTLTSFVEIDLPPNKRWAKVRGKRILCAPGNK